tara:strand:+ start:145 stop:801 length:657 start_codon:yes stop_codon:yes gene_type:complete
MKELDQLILDFGLKNNFEYNDYFVSKSNFYAFSTIDKWPSRDKKIVNIYGEKFSGKSHLANILKSKSKDVFFVNKKFSNQDLKTVKLHQTIIFDNFSNNVQEDLLYSLFNLIYQDNKHMLITSLKPLNEMEFKLKDMISRSKNCLFAKIESPDDELIFAILLKNFSDRQIYLDKKIVEFIIKRIDRSYSKIHEFIYKIDELSLKKKRPINIKTVKEII